MKVLATLCGLFGGPFLLLAASSSALHVGPWWHRFPGGYALLGLGGGIAFVLVTYGLWRLLQRAENDEESDES